MHCSDGLFKSVTALVMFVGVNYVQGGICGDGPFRSVSALMGVVGVKHAQGIATAVAVTDLL